VSINSEVEFVSLSTKPGEDRLGLLKVPMEAKFIINDGQHRRAAILSALEQRPELGSETISVVFFLDIGLERSQQMFADLNRHAIRPNRSLGLLYDHRDDKARLARMTVMMSPFYRDIVDMEKSSLAPRSRKLFTLSAFYNACAELVEQVGTGRVEVDATIARDFWESVARHFPVWGQVREGHLPASELREGYIHSHGIALQALGKGRQCAPARLPRQMEVPPEGAGEHQLVPLECATVGRARPHRREGFEGDHQRHLDHERREAGAPASAQHGRAERRKRSAQERAVIATAPWKGTKKGATLADHPIGMKPSSSKIDTLPGLKFKCEMKESEP
jgi:DGQHR domain-containing protein